MKAAVRRFPVRPVPSRARPGARGIFPLDLRKGDMPVKAYFAFADYTEMPFVSASAQAFLSPSESATYRKLESSYRKHGFLLGRYAAKLALSQYLGNPASSGIEVYSGIFNQPLVRYPAAEVPGLALSHSSRFAAAIAYEPGIVMGVDLENLDPVRYEAFKKEASPRERAMAADLGTGHGDEGAIHTLIWTMKEALSKALNCWMAAPLELLGIEELERDAQGRFVAGFRHFRQYKCCSWILPEAVLSMVHPRDLHLPSHPILPAGPGGPGSAL